MNTKIYKLDLNHKFRINTLLNKMILIYLNRKSDLKVFLIVELMKVKIL